jgi:hypothetical protein
MYFYAREYHVPLFPCWPSPKWTGLAGTSHSAQQALHHERAPWQALLRWACQSGPLVEGSTWLRGRQPPLPGAPCVSHQSATSSVPTDEGKGTRKLTGLGTATLVFPCLCILVCVGMWFRGLGRVKGRESRMTGICLLLSSFVNPAYVTT